MAEDQYNVFIDEHDTSRGPTETNENVFQIINFFRNISPNEGLGSSPIRQYRITADPTEISIFDHSRMAERYRLSQDFLVDYFVEFPLTGEYILVIEAKSKNDFRRALKQIDHSIMTIQEQIDETIRIHSASVIYMDEVLFNRYYILDRYHRLLFKRDNTFLKRKEVQLFGFRHLR